MAINAYPFPVFQPAMRIVTGITNAFPAVVTTSFAHQYLNGTIIRIDIPPGFGMQEINQQYAPIVVLSDTTFNIGIDTTLYSSFSASVLFPLSEQLAQCVPIGEINSQLTAAIQNVLPYPAS